MRVAAKVRQLVSLCSGEMHARRRQALIAAVGALTRCGSVVSVAVGRALAVHTREKHGIKRADRLLGNGALHGARLLVYRNLAALTVGDTLRPIVLVDWSQLGRDKYILKAVLALRGRGIPLFSECHPLTANGNHRVHKRFLTLLQQILPAGCRPIVITDSGFKQPWCGAVSAMGWDYVTRVRGTTRVRADESDAWFRAKECAASMGSQLLDMPCGQINVSSPIACRLVAFDDRSKRARKRPTERGRRIRARRAVRAAHEPWLLATSLATCLAQDVVELYALRMQIELSLRDDKNHALGWGLRDARTRTCERVDIQLLLLALATTAALLVGIAAEHASLQRRYQANTERRRRVLSLVTLGRRILSTGAADVLDQITFAIFDRSLDWLRQQAPRFHPLLGLI